jgi:hypothetical protein
MGEMLLNWPAGNGMQIKVTQHSTWLTLTERAAKRNDRAGRRYATEMECSEFLLELFNEYLHEIVGSRWLFGIFLQAVLREHLKANGILVGAKDPEPPINGSSSLQEFFQKYP